MIWSLARLRDLIWTSRAARSRVRRQPGENGSMRGRSMDGTDVVRNTDGPELEGWVREEALVVERPKLAALHLDHAHVRRRDVATSEAILMSRTFQREQRGAKTDRLAAGRLAA